MSDQDGAPEFVVLYHRAFEQYRTRALWNVRHFNNPTPGEALAITKALRVHGGMDGRRMAEQIEQECKAQLGWSARASH